MRQRIRHKSLSTKVTDDEYAMFTQKAQRRGLTPSEYLRLLTLERVYAPAETRILLAEMVRLQKVILTMHATVLDGGALTSDRIESIVREADSSKFELADQRIAAGLHTLETIQILAALGGKDD